MTTHQSPDDVPTPGPSSTPPPSIPPASQAPTHQAAWATAGPAAAPVPGPAAGPAEPAPPAGGGATPWFRRRPLIGLAGAGAALVLLGAGYLAGTSAHGGGADVTQLVSQSDPRSGYGQGGPFGGPGDGDGDRFRGHGRMADSATFTAGRITAVTGSDLTLTRFQNTTVTVHTDSSTVVGTSGAKVSSLSVGQFVAVTGTRQSDGSYLAKKIDTSVGRGFGRGGPGCTNGSGSTNGSGASGSAGSGT